MNNNTAASVAEIRSSYFIITRGSSHAVARDYFVVVGRGRIHCAVVIEAVNARSHRGQRDLGVGSGAAQHLISDQRGAAQVCFRPGKMNHIPDAALSEKRHAGSTGASSNGILCLQHSLTAGLTQNRSSGAVGVAHRTCRSLFAVAAGTAIDVTHLNAADFIDRDIKEVEHVPPNVRAAASPDITALHRQVGSSIGRCPG